MYTISFHDGTFQHVTDEQGSQLTVAVARGDRQVVLGRSLLVLSGISRVEPSETWFDAQQQKLLPTDVRVCVFGRKHKRGDGCRCLEELSVPVLPSEARARVAELIELQKADNLSDFGRELIEKGYVQKVVACYPSLRTLLP